jgi:hypothetical protein
VWPDLLSSTVSFEGKSNTPKLRLGKEEYKLFQGVESVNNYIFLVIETLEFVARLHFGLDTKFERY